MDMLIEKTKIEKGDIVTVKLQNGDELIGKVDRLDDHGALTLSKPLKVDLVQGQDGRPALIMTPTWILTGPQLSDDNAKFRMAATAILTMVLSNKDAKANYIQQTSGILVPGASGGLIKP